MMGSKLLMYAAKSALSAIQSRQKESSSEAIHCTPLDERICQQRSSLEANHSANAVVDKHKTGKTKAHA